MTVTTTYIFALLGVFLIVAVSCQAQDYDDEGYGGPGGQADNDNYDRGNANNNGYGSDDGYGGNMPNYQQNVDSEGTNNNPTNQQYSGQGSSDADGDYEGDDGSAAAASSLQPTIVRVRRSTNEASNENLTPSSNQDKITSESEPKLRVKRHGKYYIGPVYTYVKTDKHANFKWGVKHKVGKKHHG